VVDRNSLALLGWDLLVSTAIRPPRFDNELADRDRRYVAMHTMQENDPSSAPNESYVNGYVDGRDTSQRSKKSMRDLVASVIGMILPLLLQVGHTH
jgi:hypothetical protein